MLWWWQISAQKQKQFFFTTDVCQSSLLVEAALLALSSDDLPSVCDRNAADVPDLDPEGWWLCELGPLLVALHTDCPPVCADCPPLWTAVDNAEVLLLKAKMAHANTKKKKKEKWYMQMLKRKMVHARKKNGTCKYQKQTNKQNCQTLCGKH